MWIKHAAEPSDKEQKDTRRQDTNNHATKSFNSYSQSLGPPMESQGLCNTLDFNLISNLLHFSKSWLHSSIKKTEKSSVAFVVET